MRGDGKLALDDVHRLWLWCVRVTYSIHDLVISLSFSLSPSLLVSAYVYGCVRIKVEREACG